MTLFGFPVSIIFGVLFVLFIVFVFLAHYYGNATAPAGGMSIFFLYLVISIIFGFAALVIGLMWFFGALMARM